MKTKETSQTKVITEITRFADNEFTYRGVSSLPYMDRERRRTSGLLVWVNGMSIPKRNVHFYV